MKEQRLPPDSKQRKESCDSSELLPFRASHTSISYEVRKLLLNYLQNSVSILFSDKAMVKRSNMQAMDTAIRQGKQPEFSAITDKNQSPGKKHNGFEVRSLPTPTEQDKEYNPVIEFQSSAKKICQSPTLRERIITVLNLSKKEVETPDACQIAPEKFMFGEEFEYWSPEVEGRDSCWVVNDLLIFWENELRERIRELGIPDSEFSIKRELWEKDHTHVKMRGLCDKIKTKIGNWHCTGFKDYWSGKSLLEFNTSPYRLDQTFQVNGRTYTPYELFDLFIFSICKKMDLKPSSGHKHVDFSESIGGNTEFLFRLLVDVEDKAWLCSAFDMESYSSASTRFLTQSNDAHRRARALKKIISIYNLLLAEGYIHEKEEFHTSLQKLRPFWISITGCLNKYVPVFLPIPGSWGNTAKAKSGEIIQKPHGVTAEFRFFNTPENGREVQRLNEFLSEWMKQLNTKQINRESIEYTDYNPDKPQSREKTIEMMKHFCTQELGLPPDHYKQILKI